MTNAAGAETMSDGAQMAGARRPIVVCYDGSPSGARAIDAAGTLFPDRPAIIVYVSPRVAAERVRTTSVEAVRDELVEEVRVAGRREARALAEKGTSLARRAGLEARPVVVEMGDGVASAIVGVATAESAAAVIVGRGSRTRRASRAFSGVPRSVVDECPLPVVVV